MRKSFTVEFKAKVALEAIRGEKTLNELASEHNVHPTQVSEWKREAISGVKEIFAGKKRGRKVSEGLAEVEALYGRIGHLTVQLEWLKKKSGISL